MGARARSVVAFSAGCQDPVPVIGECGAFRLPGERRFPAGRFRGAKSPAPGAA